MKKKTVISLLVSVVLASALLAGCASTKQTSAGQEEFVYAMSGIFKPFNYKEGDGKLTGFDVEIGEALAAKMGMKPVAMTFPWETIIQGLRDNKYDAILGSMTRTEERLQAVDFTDTYYRSGSRIFVAEGNNEIKSKEDLKGKKVGVVPATNYEQAALTLTDKDKVMKYSTGDMPALMDLETGRLDAVITDDIFGHTAIAQGTVKVKAVGDLLNVDEQAIAVNKDNKALTEKLNKALADIIADGTYEEISKKWFGYNLMEQK